jgi:hypothetical protein
MVPAPAKLNAARAKTNKPPIPQHVVIKIGEVFDKNGIAHALGHGSPRPHLRRRHIRQQAHGPKHSERKQIFINPMWINYVPPEDETSASAHDHREDGVTAQQFRAAESSVAHKGWPKLCGIADFAFSDCLRRSHEGLP